MGHPGPMGPPPMRDAIRRDAMARMQSIEARLSRIEARLAQIEGGRGGPGPRPEMTPEQREQMRKRWEEARERMREGGGPGPRPEMTPEQREQMRKRWEEARKRMREGGGPGPRPEMTPEQREQMEKRMQQARGRMEDARRKFQQMQERIRELEAEVARLKKGT